MADLLDRSRPIGDEVEIFLGQTAEQLGHGKDRAIFNYRRWTEILRYPQRTTDFQNRLSLGQVSSHQLIREWLSSRQLSTESESEASTPEPYVPIADQVPVGGSSYDERLANLLLFEFSQPKTGTPPILWLAELQHFRQQAALYASCRRLARQCFDAGQSQSAGAQSTNHYERYRPPYGASLDPCFWLEREGRAGGLPFYLWDVKKRETREVQNIIEESGKLPEYMAVSHTWGRWRKSAKKAPWISFKGVKWKIPQNERFEVSQLPELLQNSPCEYVWLDLLTIPQQKFPKKMFKIQQKEISRQAVIFRNATTVVAWLNDIPTWSVMPVAVRYMSLNFWHHAMKREGHLEQVSSLRSEASAAASQFTELCEKNEKQNRDPNSRQPNAWFTSLWTLQETCLRPDMRLCNKNWEPLTVATGVPVALNDLVALMTVTITFRGRPEHEPVAIQELTRLFQKTELHYLLQLSQLSVITMANQRHCTSRRAEAIMSAIGATSWFVAEIKEDVDDNDGEDKKVSVNDEDLDEVMQEPEEKDLVIDLYPFVFVNEVRSRLGDGAFFSSTPVGWEFHYVLYKYCSEKRTKSGNFEALGSLLPFGPGAHTLAFDIQSNQFVDQHPALSTWTIQRSGHVHITQVGIVSSSITSEPLTEKIDCILAAPSPNVDDNRVVVQNPAELHEWIHSYKPWSPNFAICTGYSSLASRGIILKQMKPGTLLKIGSYWQMSPPKYELPASQEVNWLVM